MPSWKDQFPSKYDKGSDFDGSRTEQRTISVVRREDVENRDGPPEAKLVVYYEDSEKLTVLNKTNCEGLAEGCFTDDYAEWPGARVELYGVPTQMGRGVRLRVLKAPKDSNGEF